MGHPGPIRRLCDLRSNPDADPRPTHVAYPSPVGHGGKEVGVPKAHPEAG